MEAESDRISLLPEAILHHILSSIGPKQAVQTSVLSKRWQNLWSSLPILRFRCTLPRFEHFVTHFLSHRDSTSPVYEFQLSSAKTAADSAFVEKCVAYAIDHGVQRLHMDCFCSSTPFKFPEGFLAINKTLRVLRLKQYRAGGGVVVPKPFVLPNLKTLYLEGFQFNDGPNGFPKEPFSGFLDLEELTLYGCEVSHMMIISGQKLKFLEISFDETIHSREMKMGRMSAPNLTSFTHNGPTSLICEEIDFPCLEKVYFDVHANLLDDDAYVHYITDDYMAAQMTVNLDRVLQQLGNARIVTLTFDTMQVLAMNYLVLKQSPSPFPEIKCLNIVGRVYHMLEDKKRSVMNYLTNGSSYGDSLPVNYFPKGIGKQY